ncbi:hypothetical protein ACV242_005517 [Peribacillus simplex]
MNKKFFITIFVVYLCMTITDNLTILNSWLITEIVRLIICVILIFLVGFIFGNKKSETK